MPLIGPAGTDGRGGQTMTISSFTVYSIAGYLP
jgi:hypothetical protein